MEIDPNLINRDDQRETPPESFDHEQIMQDQPDTNIGMIGSVSNGKSTLTEKVSSIKTQRHSKEQTRNITMFLGYANAKIFKCSQCREPECYQPRHSKDREAFCDLCGSEMILKKHVSFVDCPGHHQLMATMLNGASVMDTTILVESVGNEKIPAQQTREHVIAIELARLPNSIVCLNKMDVVKRKTALEKLEELRDFLRGTICENSPIVPIAANRGLNIDVLCQYICTYVPEPKRDFHSPLRMIVVRSFNVNKQHLPVSDLIGAVVGGTIMRGVLRIGDRIKILPGIIERVSEDRKGGIPNWRYRPLYSTVLSINTDTIDLKMAVPGGLIGVNLNLDPSLGTKDGLVGQTIVSDQDAEHHVYETLFVHLEIIKERKDIKLAKDMILTINHNACNSLGIIEKIKGEKAQIFMMERPICCQPGDYITISYAPDPKIPSHIFLLGRAEVKEGILSNLFRQKE